MRFPTTLLLLLAGCSPADATSAATARAQQPEYQQGYKCVQAGETYRGCDHMCWNMVHRQSEFDTCIAGARAALFARIPQ